MLALRSILFVTLEIVTVIPYAFLCMLWSPLPQHWRYRLTVGWPRLAVWMAKVVCGIRYEVIGIENFPTVPCVLLPKHQSAWETMFLISHMPRELCFVYKRELHWVPFFGWGLALLRMIHIDRKRGVNAFESVVEQGTRRIAEGRCIIMFPEGTRIPVGKKGHYKTGGTRLATRLQVPVLPIAHNAGECWPKTSFIKKPGLITVSIGPAIEPGDLTPEQLLSKVEYWVETEMRASARMHTLSKKLPPRNLPGQLALQFELPLLSAPEAVPADAPPSKRRLINLSGQILDYALRRSRRRSIGFSIDEQGLTVSAPKWVTIAQIEEAITEKQRWIFAKITEMRERRRAIPKVQWDTGGTLPFLGAPITLKLAQATGAGDALRFDPETRVLSIELPSGASTQQVKDRVQGWLQSQAKRIFADRLEVFAERLGVRHRTFRLSAAATRWGSCSADGKVLLNWRLIHFPLSSIDYVVAHELAHLKEMNHGPRFWQTVADILPGFESARDHLKSPPPELLPLF